MKVKNKLIETREKEDAKNLIENGKDTKDKVNPYTPSAILNPKFPSYYANNDIITI